MNWIDEKMNEFDHLVPMVVMEGKEAVLEKLRTALEEARTQGYKEGALKQAEMDAHTVQEERNEARTQGAQEALAKVEEWAKTHKRTDDTQMSHDHIYDEALDDLLHHIQQLKDNK